MTISFDQVPIDLLTPGQFVEISNRRSARGVIGIPSVILMFGQMLPTGTATPLQPVQVLTASDAEGFFGTGAMLHLMFRGGKRNNRWTETWAIPLLDLPAGQAAAGAYTFGGTITAAGTLSLLVAGTRVRVGVGITDTPADVAAAVASALTAQTDLPVTAAVDGTTDTKVNLAARHKGECGNAIDLRHSYYDGEALPLGLTVSVTAMSGGTGNPDLAPAIAAMGDTWWSDIVSPYTDAANWALLDTELADRFGPTRQMDGFGWSAVTGTHGTISAFGSGKNSKHMAVIESAKWPVPPEVRAAMTAFVGAYALKNDPGRPLQTLQLVGDLPPATADRLTMEERNLLLQHGISTCLVDSGGNALIERVVTSYQKNAYGITDRSYLDVMTMRQIAVARYQFRAVVSQAFPRSKLGADGNAFGAGQDVATPKAIMAVLVGAGYAPLIDAAICQDMESFKSDSWVEIDADNKNRANAMLAVTFVGALIVFAAKLEFRS